MKQKGKTVWLSQAEYNLTKDSKELFREITGVKMSWGVYFSVLSLGALAAKSLSGILIRCPHCGRDTEVTLVRPEVKVHRPRLKQS